MSILQYRDIIHFRQDSGFSAEIDAVGQIYALKSIYYTYNTSYMDISYSLCTEQR